MRILGWLALISQEALAPVQARRIQMEKMRTMMRRRVRFLYKRGLTRRSIGRSSDVGRKQESSEHSYKS